MKKNKKAEEKKEPEEKKSKLPSWFNENIVTPFKAGISHTFLLHGEINDLIPNPESEDGSEEPYISLKKLLSKVFKNRKMVIFYNIASGLSFPQSEMKDEFKKSVGLESEDADPKDPIAAAKAGLAAKRNMPRDPDTCLMLIEKVLKKLPSTVVIINSIHFIAPKGGGGVELLPNERANVERIKNWSQEEGLRSNDSIIFLLTDQSAKVSSELKQGGSQIHIALITKPGKKERKEFIGSVVRKGGDAVDTEDKFAFAVPKNFDLDEFTNMTQGLSLRQILEIFLQYKKTDKPIDPNYIKEKKREILNAEYGDVMEIVNPERGLEDIGGLEYAKDFFQEIIKAIQKGESRLVSMGVTLSGPPGTGKTALVEALAYEAKFEFVKVKNVRSMWLGESEANMERLVSGLRSLAPVVVMNDEADLANAERDAPKGDAGASERIMKMWMELLSDPKIRGQVIVISCTNRPDRIDPALKRSGRSDERLLIPMPSEEERRAILM